MKGSRASSDTEQNVMFARRYKRFACETFLATQHTISRVNELQTIIVAMQSELEQNQ